MAGQPKRRKKGTAMAETKKPEGDTPKPPDTADRSRGLSSDERHGPAGTPAERAAHVAKAAEDKSPEGRLKEQAARAETAKADAEREKDGDRDMALSGPAPTPETLDVFATTDEAKTIHISVPGHETWEVGDVAYRAHGGDWTKWDGKDLPPGTYVVNGGVVASLEGPPKQVVATVGIRGYLLRSRVKNADAAARAGIFGKGIALA